MCRESFRNSKRETANYRTGATLIHERVVGHRLAPPGERVDVTKVIRIEAGCRLGKNGQTRQRTLEFVRAQTHQEGVYPCSVEEGRRIANGAPLRRQENVHDSPIGGIPTPLGKS